MVFRILVTAAAFIICLLHISFLSSVKKHIKNIPLVKFEFNGDDGMFFEARELRVGNSLDIIKFFCILFFVVAIAAKMYMIYGTSVYQSEPARLLLSLSDGMVAGLLVSFLKLFGWNPLRRGKVIVDMKEIRVPRFFIQRFYNRQTTSVRIQRISGDTFRCIVSDNGHHDMLYLGAESVDLLRRWSLPVDEEV